MTTLIEAKALRFSAGLKTVGWTLGTLVGVKIALMGTANILMLGGTYLSENTMTSAYTRNEKAEKYKRYAITFGSLVAITGLGIMTLKIGNCTYRNWVKFIELHEKYTHQRITEITNAAKHNQ